MPEPEPCGLCKRSGHHEDDHPLPKDNPLYDAFYDAPDDELAAMASEALRNWGHSDA